MPDHETARRMLEAARRDLQAITNAHLDRQGLVDRVTTLLTKVTETTVENSMSR